MTGRAPGGPALILGASGQTGSYLLRHLLQRGDSAVAAGRSAGPEPAVWRKLGIAGAIEHRQLEYADAEAVGALIAQLRPASIFVLSGQSSVRASFSAPAATMRSHILPLLNVLEAVRREGSETRIVHASSVECFGRPAAVADETAPFDPQSPYAAAKVAATMIARSYRESFGIACANVFLSNHESALRSEDFVFGMVLAGLERIAGGGADSIATGPLGIMRDFGYAPEYAAGLSAVADAGCAQDMILATGKPVLLRDAVHALFREFNIDPVTHLQESAPAAAAPPDRFAGWNPDRARLAIGWNPRWRFPDLAARLAADWQAYRDVEAGVP